jgi:hypothetical protein
VADFHQSELLVVLEESLLEERAFTHVVCFEFFIETSSGVFVIHFELVLGQLFLEVSVPARLNLMI